MVEFELIKFKNMGVREEKVKGLEMVTRRHDN